MARLHGSTVLVGCIALSGCSEPLVRPQWLLVVDTDAPLTGQLALRPDLPADAAIDTLRIDVLDEGGNLSDGREVALPDPRDWPLSFGLVAGGRVRVRLRAFRGQNAEPSPEGGLLPPPEQTIDRLVVLEGTPSEKEPLGVTLSFACLGALPSFVEPATTCHAGSVTAATEGLTAPPTVTAVGSSPFLAEIPCGAEAPTGALCIPGGFSLLGDADLSGIADTLVLDAAPPRPVHLSPFFMDRFEVSVGQYRALVTSGLVTQALPLPREAGDPDQEHCTWLGSDDGAFDALPINCIGVSSAEEVCALRGGRLPTEAEWEHAARGRGRGDTFPWGVDDPQCCVTHAGRGSGPCGNDLGPAPVGSYGATSGCPFGDVSRDGVNDLGGNLIELTSDAAVPYDAACWQHGGIAFDPRCDAADTSRVARGGSWNNSLALTHGALRKRYLPSGNAGFRCVYEAGP